MGERLGTSWVLALEAEQRFTVELARFGIEGPVAGEDAISMVFGALDGPVRQADLGPVRVGKIVSNRAQSEAGMFIDLSATEGASIAAACPRVTSEVRLRVARSSKALRAVVWVSLAVGVIAGLGVTQAFFTSWDPQLRLAVGLLLGALIGVGMIGIFSRMGALAGGRSQEVTERLAEVVQRWVEADPADVERRAKKRKKRRKKKKRAPESA